MTYGSSPYSGLVYGSSSLSEFETVWDGGAVDTSGEAIITFTTGVVFVSSPAVAPPLVINDGAETPYLRTINHVYPDPTLNDRATPVNWQPTSRAESVWGRHRVVINGEDMTYYRGVPVIIEEMADADPFGDQILNLRFPQITPFEDFRDVIPEYAEVRVERIDENEQVVGLPLWEGLVIGDSTSESSDQSGVGIECLGALYYLDFRLTTPLFVRIYEDIGHHIYNSMNLMIQTNGSNLALINKADTGLVSAQFSIGEKWLSEYYQGLLGSLQESTTSQWSIYCQGRVPEMRVKDVETEDWQVHVGQPGVSVSIQQDLIVPNTISGEGVSEENCSWRNSKYPSAETDSEIWPGYYLTVGSTDGTTDGAVSRWQERMYNAGWHVWPTTEFSIWDEVATRRLQEFAGITVDGIVGPQTWAATFDPGGNAADVYSAFIQPLYLKPEVNLVRWAADGSIIGLNPDFDISVPRIERYINYGTNTPKSTAMISAEYQVVHEWDEKGWFGTITLDIDPEVGSRWSIRSGENIVLRGWRGQDVLFHIARVSKNIEQGSVTLTVDSKARDLLTIAQLLERNRKAKEDPASRLTFGRRSSQTVEDRQPVWDCESRAGLIPTHGVQAGLWSVRRVAAAEFGEIVATEFRTFPVSRLAVGVFDRPIYANTLGNHGNPEDDNFWESMPDEWGLLIGWGGEGQMGGYYPGRDSDSDPVTGVLRDMASWYYHTLDAPWLYVAIWTETTTYVEGRLYPGQGDPGSIPRLGTVTP